MNAMQLLVHRSHVAFFAQRSCFWRGDCNMAAPAVLHSLLWLQTVLHSPHRFRVELHSPPCCRMALDGIQTPSCSIPTFASKLCDFARHPRLKAAFHTRVPAGRKNKSKQSEAKQSNAQHCKAKQRKAAQSNTNQSGVLLLSHGSSFGSQITLLFFR